MKNKLKIENILFCYKNLIKAYKNLGTGSFVSSSLGYLEASLESFGYLETVTVDGKADIKTLNIKSKYFFFWEKERKENRAEALIRMTNKLLTDKNML